MEIPSYRKIRRQVKIGRVIIAKLIKNRGKEGGLRVIARVEEGLKDLRNVITTSFRHFRRLMDPDIV